MDYIETIGVEQQRVNCLDDQLFVTPLDPRAAHCKTVEEYRLFRFSSDYSTSRGGYQDLYSEIGVDTIDDWEL